METATNANIESIDSLIRDALAKDGETIRAVVRAENGDAAAAQRRLAESGLIDSLSSRIAHSLDAVNTNPHTANPTKESSDSVNLIGSRTILQKDKRYLMVSILKGLAFLGLSDVSEIHLQYRDKRFSSPQIMSSMEPTFDFQRIIELHSTDIQVVIQSDDKMHVVVTRVHHPSGSVSLIGTTELDIRESFCGRPVKKLVEIKESGEDVTCGILEVMTESVPRDSTGAFSVSSEEVSFQLKRESRQFDEINRLFYIHAKQWWNDYLQIRNCHAQRLVKIFAHDEKGIKLPVTNFISPIRSRYLESPRHAARFVSLLGLEKQQGVGSTKTDVWSHPHTIVTLSKGNLPSLALLLASFLIGFNINAYVALGTTHNSEVSAWVITISTSGVVEFLDPPTGKRFLSCDETPWRTVGCLFNDEGFWANVGVSDSVSGSQTNFPILPYNPYPENQHHLQPHRRNDSTDLTASPQPPLTTLETELELVLKSRIAMYRDDHDLLTVWDEELAHLLTQCLCGCEYGKLYAKRSNSVTTAGGGVNAEGVSNVEFQEGVKRGIPEGHTFKGFPIHFNTLNPQKIFGTFSQAKACQNLMLTRGDKVRFGVRVKVVGYAEKCVACWVIVAVRYRAYS
ncbi:hypothetical protein BDR26DRAFT_1011765 [Obelidium mucronatum]|nr:hypothetical protein BDR26DRAFT_1011765 [Obelidium mucronatum]